MHGNLLKLRHFNRFIYRTNRGKFLEHAQIVLNQLIYGSALLFKKL